MEKVNRVGTVQRYNETAVQNQVAKGPVAAAVDATGWQFYRSGKKYTNFTLHCTYDHLFTLTL